MDEHYENTVNSPSENGKYFITQDTLDLADGKEKTVYAVYFRKDGIEEWETVRSFDTLIEAEKFVSGEIERSKKTA